MSEEPLYDFTDLSGKKRIVRITRRWGVKGPQMYVANVVDIKTKETFNGVPMTRLTRRPPEE